MTSTFSTPAAPVTSRGGRSWQRLSALTRALPGEPRGSSRSPSVSVSSSVTSSVSWRRWSSIPQLGHEGEILLVDLVGPRGWRFSVLTKPAPGSSLLAVPGNVTHGPTGGADHVVGHVGLVLTLPGLVVRSPAVSAAHLAVLTEGSVQQSQLSQLHLSQLVGTLGHLHPLLDDLLDLVDGLLHGLGVRGGHVGVQRLVLSWQGLSILPSHLPLLHAPLPADDDLGSGVFLHVLQGVPSRPDQQTHEVDVRVVVLGDHHLVAHLHLGGPEET